MWYDFSNARQQTVLLDSESVSLHVRLLRIYLNINLKAADKHGEATFE